MLSRSALAVLIFFFLFTYLFSCASDSLTLRKVRIIQRAKIFFFNWLAHKKSFVLAGVFEPFSLDKKTSTSCVLYSGLFLSSMMYVLSFIPYWPIIFLRFEGWFFCVIIMCWGFSRVVPRVALHVLLLDIWRYIPADTVIYMEYLFICCGGTWSLESKYIHSKVAIVVILWISS